MNREISSFKIILPQEGKDFISKHIQKVMESNDMWTDDHYVHEFENAFLQLVNSKYAIAVNSGISAIQTAIYAMDYDDKDYIAYVPTLTAPPTALGCLYSGMRVVFVNSNKNDLGMDPIDLKNKIKKYHDKKGLIIPVHISGIISTNIDEIISIGKEYEMPVLEDCAHAHGATFDNVAAGNKGKMGIFSFFMTKVLMSGEGGLVTTQNEELYHKSKTIHNYGKENGVYKLKGSNWRMSEFNAIVALWQTLDAHRILNEKRKIAQKYDELIHNNYYNPIKLDDRTKSSYYKYVAYLSKGINRNVLKNVLKNEYNISLPSEVYQNPCHLEPVFKLFGDKIINLNDDFEKTIEISNEQICLPIYPGLRDDEIEYIVNSINNVINQM